MYVHVHVHSTCGINPNPVSSSRCPRVQCMRACLNEVRVNVETLEICQARSTPDYNRRTIQEEPRVRHVMKPPFAVDTSTGWSESWKSVAAARPSPREVGGLKDPGRIATAIWEKKCGYSSWQQLLCVPPTISLDYVCLSDEALSL
jgi:hypothetical protein